MIDDATASIIVAVIGPLISLILAKLHIDKKSAQSDLTDYKQQIQEGNIAAQLAIDVISREMDGQPVTASDLQRIQSNVLAAVGKYNGH